MGQKEEKKEKEKEEKEKKLLDGRMDRRTNQLKVVQEVLADLKMRN